MKKATKFFINLIILLAFGAAVFFIGWVQFYVKPGNCGIMVSKTGGVYARPLVSGKFDWRWERLLPTNAKITSYSLSEYSSSVSVSGSLPSAEVYSRLVEPKPDFSYDIKIKMTVLPSPEGILNLVKSKKIESQDDLDSYLSSVIDSVGRSIAQSLVKKELDYVSPKKLSAEEIQAVTAGYASELKYITVQELEIVSAKIPDIEVYNRAKLAFNEYEQLLTEEMQRYAQEQAASLVEEDRTMAQLEKFAQLLKNYPELSEFSKNGDITEIINTLRNLR